MSLPQSMRALIFEGPHHLSLRQVAVPQPGEGDVLVCVHAAAICGSDIRIAAGAKTREVRPGHPIGHEAAGTVAAVGSGVIGYAPGDRVAVCVVVSCGECRYCLADRENLCETRITLGYHTDGAFADYMMIPARAVRRGNLFKLPDDFPLDAAPLIEPMACCINGQHEMDLNGQAVEDPTAVAIFGAGPIGILHMLLLRARLHPMVPQVSMVEPRAHRRELARTLGADEVIEPARFEAHRRFDFAIIAVGIPALIPMAIRSVRNAGRVSLFAGFPADGEVTIDPNELHYRQVRMYGASESRRRDFAEALALVADGRLDPRLIVTNRFPLEGHEEAFRVAADGSGLKVLFEMVEREGM